MNWGTMSRDERDAAYNNSNAVKNSAELNAAREAASAAFRKMHPGHLDLPYGPRELPEVARFAHEIGAYLETHGVKLILVACNTATAAALPELQESLADLTVMPNVSGLSVLNFRDAVELVTRGEDATRPMIPHLRSMLAERTANSRTIACPL